LLGLCWHSRAEAQQISSPYRYIEERHTFGLFAGYLATDPGELDLGPKSAPMFGVRYNIRLTGPLVGEVQLGVSQTSRNVYVPSASGLSNPPTLVGERDVSLVTGMAGIRFHLTGSRTWHGVAPFIVGVAGIVDDFNSIAGIDLQLQQDQVFSLGPTFAAGIGLGSDVYLTDRLAIRLEVRDHLWRIRFPDAFFEDGGRDGEWTNNFGLTIGG